ncbi:helix-turn-helix transcriptional regulator [uncultured Duncaniella sp.]|mgnify:CR=1 FL=1|uniref:helix-turn-helix transcriptional regulator n=1 Tax=uncultured Duncaniella sp. TaxID=2768039 RepID=UPI00262D5E75|nr:helix-turn-helix transcriptional regulator [uncultured Duncaniella sp.]
MSRFRYIVPNAQLQPFIRYYWIQNTNENLDVLTFPIGYPQLIFHRRTRFYIPELKSEQARFSISGQVNFPAKIQSSGDVETIVVVFYPHAIGTVFNIPLSSFYNEEIDGYSLGDKTLNALADDVLNAEDSTEAIKMIEKCLWSRLAESEIYNFKRVGVSLTQLFSDKSISVESMAQIACLSRKQFDRVFFKAVGMKPKEYSSVVRFQKSLWLMQNGNRDFADIAYSCGYADQSHFIRECRRYSGTTPVELLKTQPVYSDLFASPF